MERVINEEEVFALVESSVAPAPVARGNSQRVLRAAGATLIRRYIDVQELCAEHKLRKHHGESVALLVLIDLLADATPALTVTEAGLILSIPAATAVRKLRELAEAGLLEVHQSPTDKRRLHPLLTSMGKFFLRRYENLMGSTVDGSHLPRRRQIHRPRSERRFVDLEVSLPSERGART